MSCAVVILNWNGCEMLQRFLPSVVKYSGTEEGVIYVADNGSTDDSVAMLRREFPTVKLILLPENYGFAEGYNRALAQVEEPLVVLLNSDVEVTPHWLAPLWDYMATHPEVTACQPKIRSYLQKECFEYAGAAGGFMDSYGYPFCRGRILNVVEKDEGQYDSIVPIFWATGAALCIRKADYEAAGGLDGRFFAHMEEIDLCWRLRARGRKIVCLPQSVVYHLGGGTLQKENPRKTFLNFRNNLLMLYKNLPDEELKRVLRIRTLLDALAALNYLIKGEWRNAQAIWRARKEFALLRKEFKESREENQRAALPQPIPERTTRCILWSYYLQGKRRFSQILR